jgi:hypothetical protein
MAPPAAAVSMLCKCSRETLGPPDGYWTPTPSDVAELEEQLPDFLRDYGKVPQRWRELALFGRLYLGVVRGGVRSICVDFFRAPVDLREWGDETVAHDVCDGGSSRWSIEYDVDGHRFTMQSYNGS